MVCQFLPRERIELSWGFPHRFLRPARLPVPPPPHKGSEELRIKNGSRKAGAKEVGFLVSSKTFSSRHFSLNFGPGENRTRDLHNAIVAFSQLNYRPMVCNITRPKVMQTRPRISITASNFAVPLEPAHENFEQGKASCAHTFCGTQEK